LSACSNLLPLLYYSLAYTSLRIPWDYQMNKFTEEDWKALLIHALVSGETWVDNVFITDDLFLEERSLIHTNKLHAYQALFFETVIIGLFLAHRTLATFLVMTSLKRGLR